MNTSVSGKCILVLPLCTRILCFNKFQIDEGHCAKNVLVLTCPNFGEKKSLQHEVEIISYSKVFGDNNHCPLFF